MDKEITQFTVIFVYSDETHKHSYGIEFDSQKPMGINSSTYRKPINIEVENKRYE